MASTPEKKVKDKVKLYNSYHQECVEFLTSPPIQHSELPVIMITHHLPSYSLIDPKYMKSKGSIGPTGLNQYFASHLDDLIKSPIKAWICGHTHTGFEKRINDVTVYCNPGGYPGENEGLNMNKFIDL
jgi:Icc-related predicted phosphoesterase